MRDKIKKLLTIAFFSVWNNFGNYVYFAYNIWFYHVSIRKDITLEEFIVLQAFNHLYVILPIAVIIFFWREYLKSK
jgi:hypothetical protein